MYVSFQRLGWSLPIHAQFWVFSRLKPTAPGWTPRNHLLRSASGESRQQRPGRDAPERQGGCLCASLARSQAERAGLEIIQSAIKTRLSNQRHWYGKLRRKTPPLVPSSEGRAMRERVWDDQVKLAQLPQNLPGISKAGAEGAES